MVLAALEIAFRPDGWFHYVQDSHDLPRGPIGLLAYLPFAVAFGFIPRRWQTRYLIASSILLAFLTLGPGYSGTIAGLGLLSWLAVRTCGTYKRYRLGVAALVAANVVLLIEPQPAWLPRVSAPPLNEPLYFYLHWAGLGYIFLRSLHVLIDVGTGRMDRPRAGDFFAYLLFAPTLRMGPLYRFGEFTEQLHSHPASRRAVAPALIRFATGLLRLGIMAALLDRFPLKPFFGDRAEVFALPAPEFLASLYVAPLSIYLWISGYIDLAVGMGRLMGFVVPENFRYPWRATNIADFWRRWHITLGAWLRDYIYIPLGGNRRHVFVNYVVAFTACGLWHGTYLSYLLWGLSQGIGLAVRRRWALRWDQHRELQSPVYRRLRRFGLVGTPINAMAAWLLTFHYQILTIAWFMDERNAGRWIGERLMRMAAGSIM